MLFNRARALDYMRRYGLDALVATSPINITYFTDYFCWLDAQLKQFMTKPGAASDLIQAYAVFLLEDDPALVVGSLFAANAADLWVHDLHVFGDPGFDLSLTPAGIPELYRHLFDLLHRPQSSNSPTDALLNILKGRGLAEARIGLEFEGLPSALKRKIVQALPRAAIRDCSNLIRLVRMVKSSEEISRLKQAADIGEAASKESLALARPGLPVSEMVRHFRKRVAEAGADFDHFAIGYKGLGIATEPHYILGDGEVAYIDYGCIYQRYFSDAGTTLALAPSPQPLLQRHGVLSACISDGAKRIRPGSKASAVHNAMAEALGALGFTASFPHGHGIGLELREYPILVPDNGLRIRDGWVDLSSDLPIEEGMVLNLEAGMFVPGVGSLQVEHSYLVTADGNEPLVRRDRTGLMQVLC